MRRHRLLALAVSSVALGLGAGPAMADEPPVNAQLAEQVAGNEQSATSSATSTQYQPSNQNISVRVLSPGDNGSVDQSNTSSAASFAGNSNDTDQTVDQSQSGAGGVALQEAGQVAGNEQYADSEATSTQIKPTNQNISVRVLSEGDDGDVTQSNSSSAKSIAKNENDLDQKIDQTQGGHGCCPKKPGHRVPDGMGHGYGDDHGDDHGGGHGCGCDSTGIQAAGQEAYSKQSADSSAKSVQVKPENKNLSVRVLSPGKDGDVTQSNESKAFSGAFNSNDTEQKIDQSQGSSHRCGCHGGVGIQAAGQKALNWQDADSSAESKQIKPENKSLSVRFKSYGGGGDLTQSNASFAASFAANRNELEQKLEQTQGSSR
jgi:hypothetical protein